MYADIPSPLTLQLRGMYYTGLLLQVKGGVIVCCVCVGVRVCVPVVTTVLSQSW